SYRASMEGTLGALLEQAKDRQAEIRAQKPVDAIGRLEKAVGDKAAFEEGTESNTIAYDKLSMSAVQAILAQAKSDAAPLMTAYTGIAKDFSAYRATEAAEMAAYTALAQQASKAKLDTLTDVEQAILAAAQGASAKPNGLSMSAMQLSAQIQVFEGST